MLEESSMGFYLVPFPSIQKSRGGHVQQESFRDIESSFQFNTALASDFQISSHVRKLRCLRETTSMQVTFGGADRLAFYIGRLNLPFGLPGDISENQVDFDHNSTAFNNLHTLQIGSTAIDQSVNSKQKVDRIGASNYRSEPRKLLKTRSACVSLPDNNDFVWHNQPVRVIHDITGYRKEHITVHNAWWDRFAYNDHDGVIQLRFVKCTCQDCGPIAEPGSGILVSCCPFSTEDLVEIIAKSYTETWKNKEDLRLSFRNVPHCTANTPWSVMEKAVKQRIDMIKDKPLEFRIEREFIGWKEKFESFKEETDTEPCECCGKV